jgi:hypothetical protein
MGGYDAPAELSPEIHEKNLTQRGKEGKEAKKSGKASLLFASSLILRLCVKEVVSTFQGQ